MLGYISEKTKMLGYVILLIYCLACATSRAASHIAVVILFVLALIVFGFSIKSKDNIRDFGENILKKGFLIFFLGCSLSILVSNDSLESLKSLGQISFYFMPLLVVGVFINSREQVEKIYTCFALSVIVGGSHAVFQCLQGVKRASGFVGVMDLGGILGLLVPMMGVLAFQMHQQGNSKKKGLFMVAAIVGSIALLANGTRIIWIAAVISLLWFFIYYFSLFSRRQLFMVCGVALGVTLIALLDNYVIERFFKLFTIDGDSSNYKRVAMWKYGWSVFQEYPLTGIGFGVLPAISFGRIPGEYLLLDKAGVYGHVHSVYLQLMATTGLIGIISYLAFLYKLFNPVTRCLTRKELNYASIGCVSFIVFIVHGFTDYVLGIGPVMYLFSTLAAISLKSNDLN